MIVTGPVLHKGQLRVAELIKGPAKYVTVVSPRQVGKTFFSLQVLLYWALNEPGSVIFFVSPTYAQAAKPMEELYNAIAESGIVSSYNKSNLQIKFKNGSIIHFKSSERADSLRGYTGTHMVVDEASYHKDGVWDAVLKPIMLVKGKKVLFISTPRGTNNWFYKMYQAGQDAEQPNYASTRMHYSENPYLDLKELEEAKRSLPTHIFQAEYEGSFTDSGNTVFGDLKDNMFSQWPKPIGKVFCGLDLGRADDYTVATFMDSKGNVVDIYRENKRDWSEMVGEVLQRIRKWNATVMVETNSIGDVIFEQVKRSWQDTHPFVTSNTSKNEIIEGLIVDINNKEVMIPDENLFAPLQFELGVFEYQYSPKTRTIRYAAAPPFHDDTVMSISIANYCRKTMKEIGTYHYVKPRR